MSETWQTYYDQTQNRPPSKLLIKALGFVSKKESALDLGAGGLIESGYLLESGFNKVTAVDQESPPRDILTNLPKNKFIFIEKKFINYKFPRNAFDLVNARYSLPFNDPETFLEVWTKLTESLVENGIFCGQFFGQDDGWNTPKSKLTFHSREQIKKLLDGFEIIEFDEVNKPGTLASGSSKHWHVYNIIGKKQNKSFRTD